MNPGDFEVVDRPTARKGCWADAGNAIAATVDSGLAVRVPLNGKSAAHVGWGLIAHVRHFHGGLKMHYKTDGDHLICWAEKRKPA